MFLERAQKTFYDAVCRNFSSEYACIFSGFFFIIRTLRALCEKAKSLKSDDAKLQGLTGIYASQLSNTISDTRIKEGIYYVVVQYERDLDAA